MLESRISSSEEAQNFGLKFRSSLFSSPEEIKRIVYLVHGRAGDLNSMWIFAKQRKDSPHTLFLAPEAPIQDPLKGWSWWLVNGRSGGAASLDELKEARLKLFNFIINSKKFLGLEHVSESFAIGFSQGSGTSVSLSFERPKLFTGVGILAGFVPKVEQEIPSINRDRRVQDVRYFMAAGLKDEIIKIEQSREGRDYLKSLGVKLDYREDDVGHKISSQGIRALREWMA